MAYFPCLTAAGGGVSSIIVSDHGYIATNTSLTVTIDISKNYVVAMGRKYQFTVDQEMDVYSVMNGAVSDILISPSGGTSCTISGNVLTLRAGNSYTDYAVIEIS